MKTRLLTTLIAVFLALTSWANGTEIGGICYELDTNTMTASVTYLDYPDTYAGDITIPASVTYDGTTYSVTSIGNWAFNDCTGLTSITIPNSVTSIGEAAFYFCTGLTSITIPASVTSIGESAFSYCTSLTSIKVEAGNTTYDSRDNCNAIIETASNTLVAGCKATTIPSSVTSIGLAAFYGCTRLTSITIPSSVTSIEHAAFSYCTSLTSIKVEAGNTTYDSRDNCNAIIETASNTLVAGCKTTTIPSSVTSIGDYAFYRCSSLTSITIPSSVTSIGDWAFEGCTRLTSITIPSSVTSIGETAFSDCKGLTSITIPSSVTSIGSWAFSGCTGLTSITIPSSVTSIGGAAFSWCTSLTSIKVETGNTKYDSRDNCNAIIETASNTLVAGCKATTIPSSVTSIGELAFYFCTSLTSIDIPNSVTTIGRSAFYGCTGLTSITIPSSVTSIGWWAFNGCTGLTSINLGNSVPSIGGAAFVGCTGLTSINIPESVTTIGERAFYGCTGLTSITIPSSVTSIGWVAFRGCTSLEDIYALRTDPAAYDCATDAFNDYSATLHVPKGSKEAYAGTAPWSNFANIVDDIDTGSDDAVVLTADGEDVWTDGVLRFSVSSEENGEAVVSGVKDKDNLGAVTIPEKVKIADKVYSVTGIGERAFYECKGLTSINIPESVTSIGERAFAGCKGLTSINIPNSVISIGRWAFWNSQGLISVTIGNSVTSIGFGAFLGCYGLTSIDIPESVTSIGELAFCACPSLTSIKVEAGNTTFDSREGCNAIIQTKYNSLVAGCQTTTIPSSVTSIGASAFGSCTSLTSINIPSSVTSIGFSAFSGCTGLTSISIPESVTWIGSYVFSDCTSLTSIKVEAGNMTFDSRESCNAIIETGSNRLVAGCQSTTIPVSVTSIEDGAFDGCSGLTSINIPESVAIIGIDAFQYCTGLTSVTIGNSVTIIGERAFNYCYGLTSINIPESVTSIGESAFRGCTGLKDVYALRTDPAAYNCATDAFSDYSATLHAPAGSKEAYAGTAPWSSFANIVDDIDTGSDDAVVLTADGENVWTDGVLRFSVSSEQYGEKNGEAVVSGVKDKDNLGVVTIPEKVKIADKVYSVTSIGYGAFSGCTGLTSIDIPSSVTSIGWNAFFGCTGLTSITIPSSVTSIGSYAFDGCTGLTSITIPNSVTSIGDGAFEFCSGLTSISIPNSVTSIGRWAFYRCTGLTSVTIDNSVTSIGEGAFWGCTGLTSITIPNSVTSIGDAAFSDCTGLTSIKVETGNTKYDSRDNCNAIIETASNTLVVGCKATTIPNSVTSIGSRAFSGCTGLTSINIPNSVTSIGEGAFARCTGLTSIDIPNSVTTIGDYAFANCTGLEDIYALRTDPEAYKCSTDAFDNVPTSTCTLHVPSGSKKAYAGTAPWSNFASIVDDIDTGSDDAVVLTADGEDVWTDGVLRFSVSSEENGEAAVSGVKNQNLTTATIPEKVKIADKVYSVTSIGAKAFSICTSLTSITIPSSVTSIGEGAFSWCSGLTSIKVEAGNMKYDSRDNCNAIIETASNTLVVGCKATIIPNSVTSIGEGAFYECTGLTSIDIPSSVTSIGDYAFIYCSGLTSVEIPNSVTSIGELAFNGCSGLTSIKVETGNATYDSRESCNAIIETESNRLVAGCQATTIPSSVTSIGDYAFAGCTGLTSVETPNSVTSIGEAAFWDCIGLTSIDIPESVTSIGSYAFEGCTGLTSINIPNSVTKISYRAFCGCIGLTSITIPNSVTSIGDMAFFGCEGLTSITIPSSVTSIGAAAFEGCTGLTDIYALRTDPAAYDCATDAFSDYSATLHVPAGSKEAYASTEPWSNFANIVEEEDLTAIQSLTLTPSEAGESYYNLQGQRIACPQRGQLVIVRRADGTSRKMYVR